MRRCVPAPRRTTNGGWRRWPHHTSEQSCGRNRRRHVQRPADCGACRDEAIPSIPKALRTVDVTTGEAAQAINQRSDNTAVPAAAVVAEAMVRLTIAQYVLEKFGGDSVAETKRSAESYVASWPEHMR